MSSSGGQQPSRGGRMPFLRPIRDLTMSGGTTSMSSPSSATGPAAPGSASQARPKFMPNLAAAGRRQVPTPSTETAGTSSAATEPKRGRGRGRGANYQPGRGRGRGRPEVIQSKGIFSEGLAESTTPKASYSRPDYGGGGGGGSSKETVVYSGAKHGAKQESLESDEQALKNLMRDDFIAGPTLQNRMNPIVLPMSNMRMDLVEPEVETKSITIQDEPNIKTELDAQQCSSEQLLCEALQNVHSDLRSVFVNTAPTSESSDGGRLILVQLPNVLSNFVVGTDNVNFSTSAVTKSEPPEANGNDGKKGSETQSDEKPATDKQKHALANIPQGRIGKLQLLRSGAVRLKLDTPLDGKPMMLDATSGSRTSFLQQLVSIGTPTEQESGDLCVLGDINQKLIFSPKIDQLLESWRAGRR